MIKWALRRWLGKFEREWNYDASYMRNMIEASPRAAWLFSRAAALGQFRRDLPIDAWCAAGITAVHVRTCAPYDHEAPPLRRRVRARSRQSMRSSCPHSWRQPARAISMR